MNRTPARTEADRQARWEALKSGTYKEALNNLNFNSGSKPGDQGKDLGDSSNSQNLNNLNAQEQKRGGVPRIKLFTDETLKKAIGWGVEEWLIQVCIRDYGEYTVKGQINRIHQIPDAYFKPQYGPLEKQRGRIFNLEMQKLKKSRA